MRHQVAFDLRRIDEMRHAELLGDRFARGIQIDADDHRRARNPRALNHVEADAAETEYDYAVAGLDLRGVEHGADSGGDAASDVANLFERRVVANFRQRYLRHDGEIREGRGPHIMMQRLAVAREPAGAVGHHAAALRLANRGTQIGFAGEARGAVAAFGNIQRDDVVVAFQGRHAWPRLDDDAGALMSKDTGEQALGIGARQSVGVGVTDSGRLDFDQDFAGLWPFEVDAGDFERIAGLVRDCCFYFHGYSRDTRNIIRVRVARLTPRATRLMAVANGAKHHHTVRRA